jgi:hypothetical protein
VPDLDSKRGIRSLDRFDQLPVAQHILGEQRHGGGGEKGGWGCLRGGVGVDVCRWQLVARCLETYDQLAQYILGRVGVAR